MPKCVKNKMNSVLVILIMIIFVPFEMSAFGAIRDWQIKFFNDELAVDIENAPLGVILKEIHKRAEIEFLFDKGHSDRVITVKFGFLSLERALSRILRNLSYSILFGEDDKILRVTIIGTNKTSPVRYQEPFADDRFQERKINTEKLSEVKTEDQISPEDHEIIIESTATASEMPIEPPSSEEMEIASPSDADIIVIDPPSGEEMEITYSSTTMVIEP